ncbi:ras-GEF domain-containing family member 1B-B-like [Entelurus aequoreus]|uniref:ras-GEF domain-containing family member 1B-B-like n=1 Tax=Entelurus aequoreus TaxID=161455 RepID=UPI002B1DBDF5|nr:ras-GEF domain-containing family member 1B-B-like [Entelurus aequoreus]
MFSNKEVENSVVSASLEVLIQHLDYYPDKPYMFNFLLSSRLLLQPYELMTQVCHMCEQQKRPVDHLLDEIRFYEVAKKLLHLLTEWTEKFPYDYKDKRMMRCLRNMTHDLAGEDEYSWRDMMETTRRLTKRLSALDLYEEAALNLAAKPNGILSVCHDPVILAQQLTHIELDKMSFIGPEEFLQPFARKAPKAKGQSSRVESYMEWFHTLSSLVATEISMPMKKKQRVKVAEFFMDVAQQCLDIGNFNSLMAIIAGMNMKCVSKMKNNCKKVYIKKFQLLEHQMDPCKNFEKYRTVLCEAAEECNPADSFLDNMFIPFFSLLIEDFRPLDIDFANMRRKNEHIKNLWDISKPVSDFVLWRQAICPFSRDDNVLQYVITTPVFTEEELHRTSNESRGNVEKDNRRSFKRAFKRFFKLH